MSDPMFAGLAVRLTEDQFTSVRPDAPAVPERVSPYPRRRPAPARREQPAHGRGLGGAGAAPQLPARLNACCGEAPAILGLPWPR